MFKVLPFSSPFSSTFDHCQSTYLSLFQWLTSTFFLFFFFFSTSISTKSWLVFSYHFKANQAFYSVFCFFPLPLGLSSPSFSIVNDVTLFIYLFGQRYSSLKNNSNPSPVNTTRYVKILHTYYLISHRLIQNIPFNAMVWPLTKPQNSRSHSRGTFTTWSGH